MTESIMSSASHYTSSYPANDDYLGKFSGIAPAINIEKAYYVLLKKKIQVRLKLAMHDPLAYTVFNIDVMRLSDGLYLKYAIL